jgi:hypothetical protein
LIYEWILFNLNMHHFLLNFRVLAHWVVLGQWTDLVISAFFAGGGRYNLDDSSIVTTAVSNDLHAKMAVT